MLLDKDIVDIEKPDGIRSMKINFHDYFCINQSFSLHTHDLHK